MRAFHHPQAVRRTQHGVVVAASCAAQAAVEGVHPLDVARCAVAHVPRPGQPQSQSYEGEGYVILRHADTAAVEAGLNRVLQLMRVELGP